MILNWGETWKERLFNGTWAQRSAEAGRILAGRPQGIAEHDRRSLLRAYARGLSASVARGHMTSLEALARTGQVAGSFGTSGDDFVDDVGATLSGTTSENVIDPAGEVPEFSASGFRPEFQDTSNQVRHFSGALVAGRTFGSIGGRIANTLREALSPAGARTMADVRLGNAAAKLGAALSSGRIEPGQFSTVVREGFGAR